MVGGDRSLGNPEVKVTQTGKPTLPGQPLWLSLFIPLSSV